MRAVNLLPDGHRPIGPSGERSGSAYVLLGVLGAVLLATLGYVFVSNEVSSAREEAAALSRQAAVAEAKVTELAPFGEFSSLREARIAAVTELATGRLDWERVARELGLVLPKGSWLTSVEGSAPSGLGAANGAPPAAGTVTGPTVKLAGCAKSQPAVATTLIRLKRLNGAQEVQLESSQRAGESEPKSTKGKTKKGEGTGSSQDASSGCGEGFGFTATVVLEPTGPATPSNDPADKPAEVPASLGGGS